MLDNRDWRFDTTFEAEDADQPHPVGDFTESPLMSLLAAPSLDTADAAWL